MENNSNQETKEKAPAPHTWNTIEAKVKHLEMIQAVITRMANNSFMIKGWCITLVSALLALAVGKDGNPFVVGIAFIPVWMFWHLDGFFLQQERLFRKIYDRHSRKMETDFQITPDGTLGEIAEPIKEVKQRETLMVFYRGLLVIVSLATVFSIIWTLTLSRAKSADTKTAPSPTVTISNTVEASLKLAASPTVATGGATGALPTPTATPLPVATK